MKPSHSSKIARWAWIVIACSAATLSASAATCDRGCLLKHAEQFNSDMLARTPNKLPLAASAQIRENTKAIALDESRWFGVKQIRSAGVYTDPVLGNVVEHVAAETEVGKIVYIGTRLKVADGKITEVEINFDDGPRVNAKNLIPYDSFFSDSCARRRAVHARSTGSDHHSLLPGINGSQAGASGL